LVPVRVISDHDVVWLMVLNIGAEGRGHDGLLSPVCQALLPALVSRKERSSLLIDQIFRQLVLMDNHHSGFIEGAPVISDSGSLLKMLLLRLRVHKFVSPERFIEVRSFSWRSRVTKLVSIGTSTSVS